LEVNFKKEKRITMAHNLNFKNGRASFVSRKEMAWHGLGTIVESLTAKEALVMGGLDFQVEKRPLYVPGVALGFEDAKKFQRIGREIVRGTDTNGNDILTSNYHKLIRFNKQYSTVRTDNDFPLGIVGEKYHVFQNHEAFEFFDSIVGENYAEYETVGALGNGETIFITAKLREEMVFNKDLIDKYLLLSTSHDGSSSISVMFTPIRVVCNNTLTLALRGKNSHKVLINHTVNAKDRLENAKRVLGLVGQSKIAYEAAFGNMLNIKATDEEATEVFKKVLKLEPDDKGIYSTRAKNILDSIETYYHIGPGQPDIVGTGWGVYNAISGYFQNVKTYQADDTKFKSTFFTTQHTQRETAFSEILALK
jgi:phage/plasmid-like protein (TIGR03299 family)